MKIEHVGFQVEDPAAMSDWYVKHLGFICKRSADHPVPVRFLADETGQVMIEIYRNPDAPDVNYRPKHPLTFHLAYVCDDLDQMVMRLLENGAILFSGVQKTPAGDELVMLRDPWGVPLQLCKRAAPMV